MSVIFFHLIGKYFLQQAVMAHLFELKEYAVGALLVVPLLDEASAMLRN